VGVQLKVTDVDPPAARFATDAGVPVIVEPTESARATVKDSVCVRKFITLAVTVCGVLTTTGEGAETEFTATS
jgi:hypothetical protein